MAEFRFSNLPLAAGTDLTARCCGVGRTCVALPPDIIRCTALLDCTIRMQICHQVQLVEHLLVLF